MRPAPVRGLLHRAHPALPSRLALQLRFASSPCLALTHGHRLAVGGSGCGSSLAVAAAAAAMARHERRLIHSSDRKSSTIAEFPLPGGDTPPPQPTMEPARAPLSVLPLSMILRSLATSFVSSSPLLLPPSLRIMSMLANSASPILNPDRNPLLRFFLKRTFYAQFCAGEHAGEVRATIARLKAIGFNGVILGYAKEVAMTAAHAQRPGDEAQPVIDSEILPWAEGTLETVRLAEPGDFVALK